MNPQPGDEDYVEPERRDPWSWAAEDDIDVRGDGFQRPIVQQPQVFDDGYSVIERLRPEEIRALADGNAGDAVTEMELRQQEQLLAQFEAQKGDADVARRLQENQMSRGSEVGPERAHVTGESELSQQEIEQQQAELDRLREAGERERTDAEFAKRLQQEGTGNQPRISAYDEISESFHTAEGEAPDLLVGDGAEFHTARDGSVIEAADAGGDPGLLSDGALQAAIDEKASIWRDPITYIIGTALIASITADFCNGFGPPDTGNDFSVGAEKWDTFVADLSETEKAEWTGAGGDAYRDRIAELKDLAMRMQTADKAMHDSVNKHADIVSKTRIALEAQVLQLTTFVPVVRCIWATSPRASAAIQSTLATIAIGAVGAAVGITANKAQLTAQSVNQQAGDYRQIAQRAKSLVESSQNKGAISGSKLTVPADLTALCTSLDKAAEEAATATATTTDTAGHVASSHGPISRESNQAITTATTNRHTAGKAIQIACRDMATKLQAAHNAYRNADHTLG